MGHPFFLAARVTHPGNVIPVAIAHHCGPKIGNCGFTPKSLRLRIERYFWVRAPNYASPPTVGLRKAPNRFTQADFFNFLIQQ